MGAANAGAVRVKVLSTGADVIVNSVSDLAALSETFSPGDHIKRAMLSGAEEDAVVRAAHSACIAHRADSNPSARRW